MKKYTTIITLVAVLLLIAWWQHLDILVWIALVISLLSAVSPVAAGYIHNGWMALARLMGRINGWILLTLIFFLILTPLAWLSRRKGTGLQLRRKPAGESYFISKAHTFSKEDMEQIW